MKPFEYQAPASIDEAVALLANFGPQAKPLAGGTDLLVQLRRGLFAPELLVDVKRIPEMTQITFDRAGRFSESLALRATDIRRNRSLRTFLWWLHNLPITGTGCPH